MVSRKVEVKKREMSMWLKKFKTDASKELELGVYYVSSHIKLVLNHK